MWCPARRWTWGTWSRPSLSCRSHRPTSVLPCHPLHPPHGVCEASVSQGLSPAGGLPPISAADATVDTLPVPSILSSTLRLSLLVTSCLNPPGLPTVTLNTGRTPKLHVLSAAWHSPLCSRRTWPAPHPRLHAGVSGFSHSHLQEASLLVSPPVLPDSVPAPGS